MLRAALAQLAPAANAWRALSNSLASTSGPLSSLGAAALDPLSGRLSFVRHRSEVGSVDLFARSDAQRSRIPSRTAISSAFTVDENALRTQRTPRGFEVRSEALSPHHTHMHRRQPEFGWVVR
jgi:hypothetical protein